MSVYIVGCLTGRLLGCPVLELDRLTIQCFGFKDTVLVVQVEWYEVLRTLTCLARQALHGFPA